MRARPRACVAPAAASAPPLVLLLVLGALLLVLLMKHRSRQFLFEIEEVVDLL